LHRRVQPVKIGEVGHIALHPGDMAADPLHGGIKCGLTPASDEDIGTFWTNRCAVANPMPLVPPVMTAIFPVIFPMMFSCEVCMFRGQRTPPWTRSVSPVIQPESLEARNTATVAISAD